MPHNYSSQLCNGLRLLLLLFTMGLSYGVSGIPLDQSAQHFNISTKLSYIEDPERKLSIEDILTLHKEGGFIYEEDQVLNFGFTKSAYWFHINLHNQTVNTDEWVFNILYPLLDQVELYYMNESGELVYELAGDSLPFHFRAYSSHNINFKISLPYNEKRDYFFRVTSEGTVEMPIEVWEQESFLKQSHDSQLVFGIYYGLLLAMTLYNLMIFISIRDMSYLLCSMYILSYGMFQFSLNGLSLQYIWPLDPHLNNSLIVFFMTLGMPFILIFTKNFLRLKEHSIVLDRILSGFIIYFLIACILNFFIAYEHTIPIATFGTLVSAMFIIASAIYCFYKRFRPAKYFLLSWIALLTGMITYTLKTFSVVPSSFFTEYGIQIGSSFEVILLSFALADRIKIVTEENSQIQEQANTKLQNEVKERTQALEAQTQQAMAAKSEAEHAAQAKSQFLASMSHEIRTPLNGVLGMIELLKTTPLNNEQLEYVTTVHNSGHALVRVINDILDYSKIESGKFDIEEIPLNLSQILDNCTSIFSFSSIDSGVDLYTKVSPEVPDVIISDPTRIKQILINYLSNAFKFTKSGEVIINIDMIERPNENKKILFSVSDTGLGIEQEKIPKLFEMFSQADSSTTRKYGGTGLGLAICKKLALLLGGDAYASSELDQGSVFYFEIEYHPANEEQVKTKQKIYSDLVDKRLLIVDSSKTFRESYIQLTQRWNMKPQCVEFESDIQPLLESGQNFDIVILNISSESSADTIKNIKRLDSNSIIISTTDSSHKELCQNIIESEHLDYILEKPFNRLQLQKTILRALGSYDQAQSFKEATKEEIEFSSLNILIAEDNPVNQMVIKGAMKKMNANCEVVNDGFQVVETFRQNPRQFDLILMDCEMPNLDGYGATRQIRNIEQENQLDSIKIVALSAHALKEFEDQGNQAGMDGYLTKPINKAELIGLLSSIQAEKS